MGLLDGFLGKDWQDPQSQAVMALAGGLLSGNFGQGAKDYGNVLAGAKDTEMKRKLIDMQMQEGQMRNEALRQQFTDQKDMRDLVAQYRIPATPNGLPGGLPADTVNSLPAEFQIGGAVKPAAPRPAGFDREGYGAALESRFPDAGLAYLQKIKKDDTPVKLGAGEQLLSGAASGFKLLASGAPKPESKPSALQEYEYSRSQGYKGTFDQWDTARKRAGATSVNVTNLADNLGLKPKDRFEMEGKLRADYESQTKADSEIANTAQDIAHILKQPGALKDQAAIYKFAKALDSAGAVREADYAAIVKTAGGLEYVKNVLNKAFTGEQLSPTQRTEMANVSSALAEMGKKRIAKIQQRIAANAKMYNLNPENLFSPTENDGFSIVR